MSDRRRVRASCGLAFMLLFLSVGAGLAQSPHPCASDAVDKGLALLKLHVDDAELVKAATVDAAVKVLPPVKALKGNGRFDVLELWGHVLKADYRLRLIYARIGGACVPMGREIIEASDPY
jgi:hypothetical protein